MVPIHKPTSVFKGLSGGDFNKYPALISFTIPAGLKKTVFPPEGKRKSCCYSSLNLIFVNYFFFFCWCFQKKNLKTANVYNNPQMNVKIVLLYNSGLPLPLPNKFFFMLSFHAKMSLDTKTQNLTTTHIAESKILPVFFWLFCIMAPETQTTKDSISLCPF